MSMLTIFLETAQKWMKIFIKKSYCKLLNVLWIWFKRVDLLAIELL